MSLVCTPYGRQVLRCTFASSCLKSCHDAENAEDGFVRTVNLCHSLLFLHHGRCSVRQVQLYHDHVVSADLAKKVDYSRV